MVHEKYVKLDTGRMVKLILEAGPATDANAQRVDLNVLIKDPKDEHFHLPIEPAHPKYWKLKSMDSEKSQIMQLRYSGIRAKQIRKALKEFETLLS